MLSHKSKNKRHQKTNEKSLKTTSKPVKKSLKTKGCKYSCSSSSSSCSSSCSDSCWSACSSNSYRSCSVSSDSCGSSSSDSSSGSCGYKKVKTLKLGNKYLNVGNDTLTLRFDPSECTTSGAPTYQMGFGLANIVNGATTNNVLLLGLNETTAPYVNVSARLSGSSYIAPYVSIDFPSVNLTSTLIDENSSSTISNKQTKFVANDAWLTTSDTFALSSTYTALGVYTIGTYSTITNTLIYGPENYNFSCSVYSATSNAYTCDFRNIFVNIVFTGDSAISLDSSGLSGIQMLKHGDVRYLNLINNDAIAISHTATFSPLAGSVSAGGITWYITYTGTSPYTVSANRSLQLKVTVTFISSTVAYINVQQ